MNIELKKIDYSARLSEETMCFKAEIWVDGVKAGTASCHGHGDPVLISPRNLVELMNNHAKTLPRREFGEGHSLEMDAEMIVNGLMDDWLIMKDMKKAFAKKLLFTVPGRTGVFEIKRSPQINLLLQRGEDGASAIIKRIGAEKLLNIIPENDAFSIYKSAVTRG